MSDEFVELLESAFVYEQFDAFARAELALFVLALAAFRAAARFGFRIELAKLFETVVVLAGSGHCRHRAGAK